MTTPTQHWLDQEFTGHDFRDEDLAGLHTERVVFTECDFGGANLAESVHLGSAFRNCRFIRTTLWHSTFRNCSMLGSTFEECRIRPVVIDEVDFTLAVLAGADLRGVDLCDSARRICGGLVSTQRCGRPPTVGVLASTSLRRWPSPPRTASTSSGLKSLSRGRHASGRSR
jgi:uncharacterized protein YjbI with pentapeptide repeats